MDPRNALLRNVAEIALEIKPRILVVENVPAALSGAHRALWIALEDRIRLAGYHVARLELRGQESGIAQRRKRLFLVAWRGSGCVRFEIPQLPTLSLQEALAGLQGAPDHFPTFLEPQSEKAVIARNIPAGAKLCNVRQSANAVPTWAIPAIFGETTEFQREILVAVSRLRRRDRRRSYGDGDPVSLANLEANMGHPVLDDIRHLVALNYLKWVGQEIELKSTYNGRYRRLTWSEPAPTVDTRFGRPDLFLHPDEDRGMTVREAARVQGFPDAYSLPHSIPAGYRVIGNAVPPPMAARLGAFVRDALLKA